MSGSKRATVQISQEEYNRLRNAEVKLRASNRPSGTVQAQIETQVKTGIQANLGWILQRQEKYQELIENFHQQVREVETLTGQNIQLQQQALMDEFNHLEGNMLEATQQIVNQRYFEIHDQILSEHHSQQDQVADSNATCTG